MLRVRLLSALVISAGVASAPAQVWEKLVAPGLTYRMELDTNLPRMIHALRWTPGAKAVTAKPELGLGVVFANAENNGRETISDMVRRTGGIAGINADFFPWTGDPLGLMIKDSELLSLPWPTRSGFFWGAETGPFIGRATLSARLDNGATLPLAGLNSEVPIDQMGLFSPRAGLARAKTPNRHAVLRVVSGDWKLGSTLVLEVESVGPESPAPAIPENRAILTGTGNQLAAVAGMRPGTRLTVELKINGLAAGAQQAVGGGPNLVTKGLLAVDAEAQQFNADFTTKRHPRTAVGRTADGDLWFVTVDGRQKMSDGATLEELAKVMQRLGCMEAINLDGGGSTTLNLFGLTLNRPSDGRERPVANGIIFYGPKPAAKGTFKLQLPTTVKPNTTSLLRVLDAKGAIVPSRRVLWMATGSGWIDQGGFLRTTAEGTVFVTAWVDGATVSDGIQVAP